MRWKSSTSSARGVRPKPGRSHVTTGQPAATRRSASGAHIRLSGIPAWTRKTACPSPRTSWWIVTPSRLGGELAAGGVDVAAAGEADGRAQAALLEHRPERVDRRAARALVHPGRVV